MRVIIRLGVVIWLLVLLALVGVVGWGQQQSEWGFMTFESRRDDNSEIYAVDPERQIFVNLSRHRKEDTDHVWAPDGEHIAFISKRDGNMEIYLFDWNGRNLTNVSQHAKPDWNPVWSPDGSKLAYFSYINQDVEIMVYDLESGERRNLSKRPGDEGTIIWSYDSRYLAFLPVGENDVFIVKADGTEMRNVTNTPDRHEFNVQWSPTRNQIIYEAGFIDREFGLIDARDIYLADIDRHEIINISKHPADDLFPFWSPDGEWIAFYSWRENGDREIFIADRGGETLRNLSNQRGREEGAVWSPDSQKQAFVVGGRPDTLYVVDVEAQQAQAVAEYLLPDTLPIWAPDSRHIALVSWRDANREVYVIDTLTGDIRNISNNPVTDTNPVWRPIVSLEWQ